MAKASGFVETPEHKAETRRQFSEMLGNVGKRFLERKAQQPMTTMSTVKPTRARPSARRSTPTATTAPEPPTPMPGPTGGNKMVRGRPIQRPKR